MLSVEATYCSDAGDRDLNQDRAAILENGRVCLVADGMGGPKGGDVASDLAVDTVWRSVAEGLLSPALAGEALSSGLRAVMAEANQRVVDAGAQRALVGLGTTLTLAVIGENGLHFAHIGDTRLYHWREGIARQLTEDHTRRQELLHRGLLPQQAASLEHANVLVRYLGTTRRVVPQLGSLRLQPGDRLLICSDGLYTAVDPALLRCTLSRGERPGDAARGLVAAARRHGGAQLDNVTALVAAVEG